MEGAARAGFVARGVIYLLVGLLALQLAFSAGKGGQADRGGALEEIAGKPFGSFLLWALGVGLAGMAVWRLSEACFGAAGPDGNKPGKRAASAARAAFYGFVCYSVLSFALGDQGSGSGSTDKQSRDVTAQALDLPGGQWIVAVGAAGVTGAGLWMAIRAALRKYHKHLKTARMSKPARRLVDGTGVPGGIARGAVFAAAGGFALKAAWEFEPDKAKGMDDTLRAFTQTPAGPWLLAAVALGLALFGIFSFCSAHWREV